MASWKQKYEDNSMLKIELMIPLLQNAEYSDALKDAIDDMDIKDYCKFTGLKKKDAEWHLDEGSGVQYFIEANEGKFLCRIATPKMDGNMFSWGYTVLDTIIAKDMDDLVDQGLKFVAKYGKAKK